MTRYAGFESMRVGGCDVTLHTPGQTFVQRKAIEGEVAGDRRRREVAAGISEKERYSALRSVRDWNEYIGADNTPVIQIAVRPRAGETGGSVFARALVSPYLKATYKYEADVRGVRVLRNGVAVECLRGGHRPMVTYVNERWVTLKDVADEGVYVFSPELLEPSVDGQAPTIFLMVDDLKNPGRPRCGEMPPRVVAQAWNEFESFYRAMYPGRPFLRAKALPHTRPAMFDAQYKDACDWGW
jgi:hypothetical protein